MPDRLPSLVLLVGFWMPPAAVGFAAADLVRRSSTRFRPAVIYSVLAISPSAGPRSGFSFSSHAAVRTRATRDPTFAPPEAVAGLAVVASALVLPGSVIACLLAFRSRGRSLRRTSAARLSA